MRRLVAGPWVGEFGWQLLMWQGLVRRVARDFDEVLVCGPEGCNALYSDFATKYIPHQLRGQRDCWNIEPSPELSATKRYLAGLRGYQLRPSGVIPLKAQTFIRYGSAVRARATGAVYDFLLHARGVFGKRGNCSWPQSSWDALGAKLRGLRVAAIGTDAFLPAWTVDLRNLPLHELMDVIAASGCVVGPSSGPIHLASLCGTPHAVWTDDRLYQAVRMTNRIRYEHAWNPLQTPCAVLDSHGWHPPVDVVYDFIMERLSKWHKQ